MVKRIPKPHADKTTMGENNRHPDQRNSTTRDIRGSSGQHLPANVATTNERPESGNTK